MHNEREWRRDWHATEFWVIARQISLEWEQPSRYTGIVRRFPARGYFLGDVTVNFFEYLVGAAFAIVVVGSMLVFLWLALQYRMARQSVHWPVAQGEIIYVQVQRFERRTQWRWIVRLSTVTHADFLPV